MTQLHLYFNCSQSPIKVSAYLFFFFKLLISKDFKKEIKRCWDKKNPREKRMREKILRGKNLKMILVYILFLAVSIDSF